MLRILLIDDHELVRAGMCMMLGREPDITVVGQGDNEESALALCDELRPDVVLMDISLQNGSGIDITRRIVAEFPLVRVIAVSSHFDRSSINRMLAAGAIGFINKTSGSDELLSGIRTAVPGAPFLCRNSVAVLEGRISSVTVEKEWAFGALNQLRMGVILTNSIGEHLFINSAAAPMLASGMGISSRQGKLALPKAAETAQLYQLITDAAQDAPGANRGGDMRITLPGGEFLHCMVMPISMELSARLDASTASECVAIFLSKPSGLQLHTQRLADMYGLTKAEARLAGKLAELKSVEQAANELFITVLTARSQLKNVFYKVGAHSQSELLMLLSTSTLANCRDNEPMSIRTL